MKNAGLILGLFVGALASSQSFAFTANGKYQVVSATSIVDVSGNVRCFATRSFNSFGKIGDIVDISISNSEVIATEDVNVPTAEFVDLKSVPPGPGNGLGAGNDPISIDATFGASADTFVINDAQVPTLPVTVTVELNGNNIVYQQSGSGINGTCVLAKVGQ
jgi:hypothetical protein